MAHDKSLKEYIAEMDAAYAALKSHVGGDEPGDEEPEIEERSVGRGRKKRPAPFFKKKGEEESSEEDE